MIRSTDMFNGFNTQDKKDEKSKVSPLLLIALFMAGGMVDTLAKIYGYYGNSNLQYKRCSN